MTAKETYARVPSKLEPATHVGTSEIVIEPARGWSPLRLRELWEYRDLFYYMTTRNLSTRYRQMALGPLWIVLQPLMSMFLYSLIFGRIAKLPSDGQPYAVFTYVALLPWTFFSDAVAAGANSLADNKNLISKVYFPRLIPAITQVVSALVDFGISFLILVVMLIVYGIRPNAGILLLPVFLVFAGLTGLAVGLWFAGIIVRYRDFGQVLGYLMRFGMYATPVVYSISLVPAEWRPLYRLNPMTGVIEGFRWALLGTGVPPDWTMIVSAIIVLAILVGALYNFKRVERNVVDVA